MIETSQSHGRLETSSKGKETRLVIFLVVFLFPLLSIALVGGFGFAVWITQMIFGPPGPAH